ncbi:hypothetical protein VPH35_104722 [Triticum aestivum]|uniref:uncharacterized protein n=1 Tax=Triticum aestivum TaxID=4565 RepID=UPI00084552DF|nr:uncharacterized protein LOC123130617 [Triticum aestivum]
MSMRFSVIYFIVSTTGSSSGSNVNVTLIVCLRHGHRVLAVDPRLLVHPGPVQARHRPSRDPETDAAPLIDYVGDDTSSLSAKLPDVGAQESDATIDAYYYVQTTDDQE